MTVRNFPDELYAGPDLDLWGPLGRHRVCTVCIQDIKGIHSNLGHVLWSLQSMEGISIGNEKMSAYPHYRC